MVGSLLAFLSAGFHEVGTSVGKWEVARHRESMYTMGFLNMLWGIAFFAAFAFLAGRPFVFSAASLPTFSVRVLLEILQAHVSVLAILRAERSTYSFVRVWTIPLLLLVDLALGYSIRSAQIAAIVLLVASFLYLSKNHGIGKRGLGLAAFTAVNAVATISLYKYDISHFNSVEAEQGIVMSVVMVYFFSMALLVARENPFAIIRRQRAVLAQSVSVGAGDVLGSFAILFAPASIIIALSRSFSMLWAIAAGNVYFHEKRPFLKFTAFILISVGIAALVL